MQVLDLRLPEMLTLAMIRMPRIAERSINRRDVPARRV